VRQVYQFLRDFLPFAALGTEIANPVVLHRVFADNMIAALFKVKLEGVAEQ
jgi:hypothetical protein